MYNKKNKIFKNGTEVITHRENKTCFVFSIISGRQFCFLLLPDFLVSVQPIDKNQTSITNLLTKHWTLKRGYCVKLIKHVMISHL